LSSWGIAEWAVILGGAYVVGSVLFTTKRAASAVRRLPGERRKKRAAHYRKLASELTSKKK
jgi:hypothetical protein